MICVHSNILFRTSRNSTSIHTWSLVAPEHQSILDCSAPLLTPPAMSSPGPAAASSPPTPRGKGPTASSSNVADDAVDFSWTCRCTNIRVHGKIAEKDRLRVESERQGSSDSGPLQVKVGSNAERVVSFPSTACRPRLPPMLAASSPSKLTLLQRQTRFAVYDGDDEDRGRGREAGGSDNTSRRCTLCDVRMYRVSGNRERNAPAACDKSVAVDLADGIVVGS